MAKEATLKIGNSFVDGSKAVEQVAAAIAVIFKSAKENGIEQETIQQALSTLGQVAKVENVTVTNSIFKGDKTINVNDDDDELPEE